MQTICQLHSDAAISDMIIIITFTTSWEHIPEKSMEILWKGEFLS